MNNYLSLARLLLFCGLGALSSNCGRTKQADPIPQEYAVRVHVVGDNLVGGSAIIHSTTDYAGLKGSPIIKPVITTIYSTTVNETYDLGKLGSADQVQVRIEMSGYSASGTLRADIIVNEVVKKSCYITGGGLFETCELTTDKL